MQKKSMRILAASLAISVCGVLAGCSQNASSAQTSGHSYTPKALNVQYVPSTSENSADTKAKPLAEQLQKTLGIPVKVTVSTDYNTVIEAMKSKQVDVGIMPPASYVLAKKQNAADAILQAERYAIQQPGGVISTTKTSSYRAEVVFKKGENIKSFADLKGKKIAVQDVTSASGYIFPIVEMKQAGLNPDKDTQMVTVNGIDNAILAVLNGQVDAAFSFEDGRNLVKKDYPDIYDQLDAIFTKGQIPNDAIAVRSDLSDAWRKKISNAFLKVAADPDGAKVINQLFSHVGYVKADDSAFNIIREYSQKAQ